MSAIATATVRSIHRYLVKSMAGETLDHATLGWHGISGDRRFAIRRVGNVTGRPWLTASRLATLVCYQPSAPDGADPLDPATIEVRAASGERFTLAGPGLCEHLAAALGAGVELVHIDNGIFDDAPLSIISRQTVIAIGAAAEVAIDARRFRPNVVVDVAGGKPFPEDEWVGKLLRFGDASDAPIVSVSQRDLRCVMINLDPDSAASDPRVLKTVGRERDARAGVYATVVRAGVLHAGASVHVREI